MTRLRSPEAIDGATGDWSMSGDAMRWSPDLAQREGRCGRAARAGRRSRDRRGPRPGHEPVRRLVTGALNSLGAVATDVVTEFRQLTRGSTPADRGQDEGSSG